FAAVADAAAVHAVAPQPAAPAPIAAGARRPRSLGEALELLAKAPGVRPLAGGTDAMVRAKDGALRVEDQFDLRAVPELQGIPLREGVRGSFLRLGQRQAQAISKVSVAVQATVESGRPSWVRVALGAVAPTVIRAPRTEAELIAGWPDRLSAAVSAVRDEVK